MELSKNAIKVLEARYLPRNAERRIVETPVQLFESVAHGVADAELLRGGSRQAAYWQELSLKLLTALDFLPNTQTLMKAGKPLGQLSACFVLPVDRVQLEMNPGGESKSNDLISLFLCGDVMTGRGIDQILPHPSDPVLHEPYIRDARDYVSLAERVNGRIPHPVDPAYMWGDALEELKKVKPDLRIINLETSITRSDDYWEGKGIHYRMHPENIDSLKAALIDVCPLANNHILDWGHSGLKETLETLKMAGIKSAGAGMNLREARTPAVATIEGKGRVVLFAFGSPTSGVPSNWAASDRRPGVDFLKDFSDETIRSIRERVLKVKRDQDVVLASIHWGGNWGYLVPPEEVEFAHNLIDTAGIDLVYGHSSHHVKGIEVYKDRLILYGCGDFLNDYEGIGGYERFRDDLGLMYFADLDPKTGRLARLEMRPTRVKQFKVNRASNEEAHWLADVLNREGKRFGTRVKRSQDDVLTLLWGESLRGYPVSMD